MQVITSEDLETVKLVVPAYKDNLYHHWIKYQCKVHDLSMQLAVLKEKYERFLVDIGEIQSHSYFEEPLKFVYTNDLTDPEDTVMANIMESKIAKAPQFKFRMPLHGKILENYRELAKIYEEDPEAFRRYKEKQLMFAEHTTYTDIVSFCVSAFDLGIDPNKYEPLKWVGTMAKLEERTGAKYGVDNYQKLFDETMEMCKEVKAMKYKHSAYLHTMRERERFLEWHP